jgi:hypothetical protein
MQSKLQSLKATLVLAELIIGPKEVIELKSGRKQEPATRRRLTPSLSTNPWCQAFGVGEGSVAGQDSTTLGRQLAVALRAYGAASLSSLDELVRREQAAQNEVVEEERRTNEWARAWSALPEGPEKEAAGVTYTDVAGRFSAAQRNLEQIQNQLASLRR